MNKKFNESEIILGRLPQNKVVPMLIIKANNEIFGLQLYKYHSRKLKILPKIRKIKTPNVFHKNVRIDLKFL